MIQSINKIDASSTYKQPKSVSEIRELSTADLGKRKEGTSHCSSESLLQVRLTPWEAIVFEFGHCFQLVLHYVEGLVAAFRI